MKEGHDPKKIHYGVDWNDILDNQNHLNSWLETKLSYIYDDLEEKYIQTIEDFLKENKEQILNLANHEVYLWDNELVDEDTLEKIYTDEEILEKIREDLIDSLLDIVTDTLQDNILLDCNIKLSTEDMKDTYFKKLLKKETIEHLVDSIVFDK